MSDRMVIGVVLPDGYTSATDFAKDCNVEVVGQCTEAVFKNARNDFRWLIEAPGSRYLAVQRLSMSNNFEWSADHNKALAFRSQDQADALMMAVRQMDREFNGGVLFAFERTLGDAKATEHGWFARPAVADLAPTH